MDVGFLVYSNNNRTVMKQAIWTFLGCLLLVETHAASFDCAGQLDSLEKLICSDSQLSRYDELLSLSYKKALKVSAKRADLIQSQRSWIREIRNKCANQDCLSNAYNSRIQELENVGAIVSPDPLAEIEGTYLMHSSSCTVIDSEGDWKACPPTTVDCLSIKRLAIDTAYISVESYQTNGHMCSATGTAKIVRERVLELSELEEGFIDIASHPVTLNFSNDLIEIDGPQDICGARASWDGVAFAKIARKTKEAITCSDYQSLNSLKTSIAQ